MTTSAQEFVPLQSRIRRIRDIGGLKRELENAPWFMESSLAVQKQILDFPANWEPCFRDLLARPRKLGQLTFLYIVGIYAPPTTEEEPEAPYGALFQMMIGTPEGERKRLMYTWYRGGEHAGAKGPVLVEKDGVITHIVLLQGVSSAAWKIVYDCTGGGADFIDGQPESPRETYAREVREELRLEGEAFALQKIYELGQVFSEQSVGPMNPHLCAGVISWEMYERFIVPRVRQQIKAETVGDLDETPNIVVNHVSELWTPNGLVQQARDSYFLSAVTLLIARRVLPGPS